jgi:hypothetical protein
MEYSLNSEGERSGLLESRWLALSGRRRRMDELTKRGPKQSEKQREWQQFSAGMNGCGRSVEMSTTETYLAELAKEVRRLGVFEKRITEETRKHLLEARETLVKCGLNDSEAKT